MISFQNKDTAYRLTGRRKVAGWLGEVARREGFKPGEIAVVFTSDAYVLEVNRSYLGHDYPTDIITFDYRDPLLPQVISGDLLISVDTVAANAQRFGVAPGEEMLRVIVHGILHLCGHGDKTAAERAAIRSLEDSYLALFAEFAGTGLVGTNVAGQ